MTSRQIAQLIAGIVVAAGLVVAVGRRLDAPALTRFDSAYPSMTFTTAICFVFLGSAIAARAKDRVRLARGLALLPIALGLLTLWEYGSGRAVGIGPIVTDLGDRTMPFPGPMALVTPLSMVLLGATQQLPTTRHQVYESLALLSAFMAYFVVATHGYGALVLGQPTDLALMGALCVLLAAVGIFMAKPDNGTVALLWSRDLGGRVARLLVLFGFFAPFGFGYLQVVATRRGWLALGQAEALTQSLIFLLSMIVITFAGRSIQSLDRAKTAQAQQLALAKERVNEAEKATVRGTWDWTPATQMAWSDSMFHLLGATKGHDTDAQSLSAFLHPDDQAEFRQFMAQAIARPGAHQLDARLLRRDGEVRGLRFEGVSLPDERGKVSRISGHVQDITARKALEEEQRKVRDQEKDLQLLSSVSDFKSKFINLAAHELRTPLTPIQLGLATLRVQTEGMPGGSPSSIATLQRNVDRLASLTQNLIDAAGLQSKEIYLHKSPCDLVALATQAARVFQPKATHKGVHLSVKPSPIVTLRIDERKIETVLHHLVDNAVKFTPQGGKVSIQVTSGLKEASVAVQDDGPGLRTDQVARIFEPFVQVHKTMEVSEPGAGLGLYIGRGIVELHGGRIWAESKGPGMGCTFGFTLPSLQDPQRSPLSTGGGPPA